jgi:hypothetical protein
MPTLLSLRRDRGDPRPRRHHQRRREKATPAWPWRPALRDVKPAAQIWILFRHVRNSFHNPKKPTSIDHVRNANTNYTIFPPRQDEKVWTIYTFYPRVPRLLLVATIMCLLRRMSSWCGICLSSPKRNANISCLRLRLLLSLLLQAMISCFLYENQIWDTGMFLSVPKRA